MRRRTKAREREDRLWEAMNEYGGTGAGGTYYAHYTSAENALRIIDGETLWLRSAAS